MDSQAFRGGSLAVVALCRWCDSVCLLSTAMNDACLVFDHWLVIDADHHTNDPLIFAAGPITKYSRRYRADQW